MMDGYPSGVVGGAGEYARGERQEYTLEDSLVPRRAYTLFTLSPHTGAI